MRRFPALLCAAGLAAAPASAAAGPFDPWSTTQSRTVERFEWSTSKGRLGVMVMSLTSELRKHFGAPEDRGVLVARVDPGTPAAMAGVVVGDVIVEVHGRKIDSATDVLSALADLGKGAHAKIELVRKGQRRSLDATLTGNVTANASWLPPWLHDWMKPFDEPTWFRDWLRPLEQTKQDADLTPKPEWLRKLRELFESKHAPPVVQRS